jgi:lysophospholipase L1-like esterase
VDSDVTVPKTVGGDVVAISDAVDGDSTTPKYIAGGVAIREADLTSNRDICQSDLKTQNTNIMCLLDMMSKQTHLISGLATKLDGMSKRLDKMDKRDSVHVSKIDELVTENRKLRATVGNLTHGISSNTWSNFRRGQDSEKTLLMGTSLLRDVDAEKLRNTDVVCKRGGHIRDFVKTVKDMTSDNHYDRAVLVLGGNDCASSSKTASTVIEEYSNLVKELKSRCQTVTVSSVCPRLKPDNIKEQIDAVNAGLQSMCADDDKTTFINNDPIFHLADGSINDGYLLTDGVHLRRQATTKLARNLKLNIISHNEGVCVDVNRRRDVRDTDRNSHENSSDHDTPELSHVFWNTAQRKVRSNIKSSTSQQYGSNNRHHQQRDSTTDEHYACHNCGETNHNQRKCRYSYRLDCRVCGQEGHKAKHHDQDSTY